MDIAIIGMGARLPGDASTPEGFWELLTKARSALTEAPKSRYNAEAFYHPDPDRAGTATTTKAHFLNQDPGVFDAPFFSITPAEAKAIDPQQRLLLEVSYEALENAGLRIESLKGSKTSCYAGSFTGDYRDLTMHDNEGHGLYTATGTHTSLVANRVSWFYDLAGPSVTMDTACSASLTAFHLACQGMRNGESDLSLVAGTHLILGPDSTLLLGAGRILSPQGTSKAFDHRADGYGRGEGVGVVVLKPLQAALRDGDTIRAVVLGSAANHNGRTPSPSQPSSDAQMALIRTAYEQAGIETQHCGFVEAHGTGTAVGDPLETRAIAETLGKDRTTDLYVGSAKTNIGHLESAAGMAGLIKCVLVVEKGIVPPNLWFEKLNPRIQLPDRVKVPTAPVPWPGSGMRIASVNSFGFGGANAHVIIGDAYHFLHERGLSGLHRTELRPAVVPANAVNGHANGHTNGVNGSANGTNGHTNGVNGSTSAAPPHPKLLVLSAQDKQGPERLGAQLSAYLANPSLPPSTLSDLAHTLSQRRSRLLWKSFAIAPSVPAAQTALSRPSRAVRSALRPRLAFVFTGQGAQWHAMGRELFAHYEPFRASIAASDATLNALGCTWSIRDELSRPADATRVNDAQLSQPLCVALQVALVDLLAHLGLRPAAVVGHSSGEMGAAYGAGALSREAAVALAWWRGVYAARVEQADDLDGTMLAVRAGGDAVRPRLDALRNGKAVVGCFNSPRNCTVSGDRKALEELRALLEADGVGSTPLKVGVAYHSPHMRRIADEYREAVASAVKAAGPPPATGTVPFFSSVTGKLLPPAELGASYWVDNLVSSVNFTGAVQSMIRSTRDGAVDGAAAFVDAFVEVGPHSALRTYLNEICAEESVPASIPYSTVLRRNFSAVDSLLTAAGELWCLGADVDVERVNLTDKGARMLTDLKPYPFNHSSSYWAESAITRQYRFRQQPRTDHLGVRFDGSVTPQWRNFLKPRENPWLEHHKIKSEIVYPSAGLVVMAIEAIKQLADPNEQIAAFELRDLALNDPLRILDEERGAEVMTQVKPSTTGPWADFAVVSRSGDGDWSKPHCQGKVRATYQSQITAAAQTELEWEQKKLAELYNKAIIDCDRPEDTFYETLESAGCEYGPSFRSLSSLYLGDRAGRGIARVPDTKSLMPYNFEYPTVIHPATLASFMQMVFPALTESGAALNASSTASPVAVDRVYLSADVAFSPGKEFDVFSQGKKTGGATQDVSVYALQPSSPAPAVVIEGMRIVGGLEGVESSPSLCFDTLWREDVNLLNQEQVADAIFSRAEPDPFDSEHYAMLDVVALPYIQDAVDWLQHAGKQHAPADGFLQLFYAWMVDKLRENAGLVADAAALRTKAETAVVELQNTEAGAVTVELIHRVGENLKGIMSGEVEPLEVMLKNGLLRVGLGTSFNSNVAEYMGMLAHKGAGQLRILEIGGGTGGTTRRILDAIRTPGVASYVFTDVSPGFLGNAATNFARDAAVMQFKTLNIEEDPAAQGFAPESFDVLVCANVLHATCRIRDTLSRCRSLLKKDGRLVLAELTDNPVFMGLMMGPLPGWWLGEDDGRHGGPIITAPEWDAALKDAGFTGVDIHIRGDKNARDGRSPTALIVSTRKDERPAVSNKPELRLLVDGSAEAKRLAATLLPRLVADGEKVTVLTWGPSTVPSASAVRDCYCVCLVGPRRADKKLHDLLASAAGVCWVSQDASSPNSQPSSLPVAVGAGKVVTIDLDPTTSAVDDDVPTLHRLLTELLASNPSPATETEYAIRNGVAQIPRLALTNDAVPSTSNGGQHQETIQLSQTTEPLHLAVQAPGVISFEPNEASTSPLPPTHIELRIAFAGVNARDAAATFNTTTTTTTTLGHGCSGVVTRVGSAVTSLQPGDPVAALCPTGALATHARLPASHAVPLPAGVALADAAAWALPYATAWHALAQVARLRKGESVLVHAGAAGGVGQAAVVLARQLGAGEVYVSVGSEEKRALLVREYGIPEENVFAGREGGGAWARALGRVTGGRGVDVVLSSAVGEAREVAWRECLADLGRFVDIGDSDGVDALPLRKNRSYFRVDLYELVRKESKALESIMDGVSELVRSGAVKTAKPLSVYGAGKIETVLGYMQTGEHMGKTVIEMSTDEQVKYTPRPPRITLHHDATYVLAGGFAAGAGRELARWLVSRGAQHLVILSESAASHTIDEGHAHSLRDDHGIQAAAIFADGPSSLDKAIQSVQKPIKGVIIGDMSQKSQHPAVAFYDLQTALSAAPIDFFIRLSSGNTSGPTAFPTKRSSSTKALSVTLGLGTSLQGTPPLRAVEAAIEAALARDTNSSGNMTIISPPPVNHSATATDSDPHLHPARFGPLKQHLQHLRTAASASSSTASTSSDPTATETLSAGLARVTTTDSPPTAAAVAALVSAHLRARMARLMMVPADEVDPQRPLAAYGVDSLVAAELRNWLVKETGVNVAVTRLTRGDVAMVEVAWEVARERVGEKVEVVVVNGGGGKV
ncbi:Type I Iterative PKS [Diplodia intermedia]|uniref:Type I Iterative PKS n=1 Tax=Diplodia intermedia TaxID=856260 RepID=A0ABR3TC56_9PEZI